MDKELNTKKESQNETGQIKEIADMLSVNFCEFRLRSLADKIKTELKKPKLKNIIL